MNILVSLNGQRPGLAVLRNITYRSSALQQDSVADVFVPRSSSMFTADHIPERKSYSVKIYAETGNILGMAEGISWDNDGVLIKVAGMTRALGARTVGTPPPGTNTATFINQTTGTIVREALKLALANHEGPLIRIGNISMGPPLVREYTFDKQPFRQVLDDMVGFAKYEYSFDDNIFSYYPTSTRLYSTMLVDGRNCTVSRSTDYNDQLWQINSPKPGHFPVTVRAPHNSGIWSREVYRESAQVSLLNRALDIAGQLEDTQFANDVYRLGVYNQGTLWADLREGMAVSVVCPRFGFHDSDVVLRILSRTYQQGSDIMNMEVQLLIKPEGIGISGIGQEIPRYVRPISTEGLQVFYRMTLLNWPNLNNSVITFT